MRDLLLPFAALAVAFPAVAAAADGCPKQAAADVVTALGDSAATLGGDQTVYQPTGVTVMELPVSYVVVTKGAGGSIEEIDYRLQGIMRNYNEHYPKAVLEAFDKAYPGVGCSTGRVTACAMAYDLKGAPGKALADARIGDPGFDVPAAGQGAVLGTIKTEYAHQDSGPVFLMCRYGGGG